MIKDGKKPISSKNRPFIGAALPYHVSLLDLPEPLRKELDEKGLDARWCDAKTMYDFGGYHKHGWVPYRREKSDTINNVEWKFGNDPDGIVRRGTCILGVRPKEVSEARKQAAELQRQRRVKGLQKQHADQLRESARAAGVEATISEGYEEDES